MITENGVKWTHRHGWRDYQEDVDIHSGGHTDMGEQEVVNISSKGHTDLDGKNIERFIIVDEDVIRRTCRQ